MIEGILLDALLRAPGVPLFALCAAYLYAIDQRPAAPLMALAAGAHGMGLVLFYALVAGGSRLPAEWAWWGMSAMSLFDYGGAFLGFGLAVASFASLRPR